MEAQEEAESFNKIGIHFENHRSLGSVKNKPQILERIAGQHRRTIICGGTVFLPSASTIQELVVRNQGDRQFKVILKLGKANARQTNR